MGLLMCLSWRSVCRQAEKNAQAYSHAMDTAYRQAQPAAMAPVPDQGAVQEDTITQLERLGALKAQGLLTDEEFQAEKAKILGL